MAISVKLMTSEDSIDKVNKECDDFDEPWPVDMEQQRLKDLEQWTLRNADHPVRVFKPYRSCAMFSDKFAAACPLQIGASMPFYVTSVWDCTVMKLCQQVRKVLAHLNGNEAASSSDDEDKPSCPFKRKKKAVDRCEMNKWDDVTTGQLLVAMNRFQESLNHMDKKGIRVSTHSRWAVISRSLPNQLGLNPEKFAMSCRAHFANLCRVYKGQKRLVKDVELPPILRQCITEYFQRCAHVRSSRKKQGMTVEGILELMNSKSITSLVTIDREMGNLTQEKKSVTPHPTSATQANKSDTESDGGHDRADESCHSLLSNRDKPFASENGLRESITDKSRYGSTAGHSLKREHLESIDNIRESVRKNSRRLVKKAETEPPNFQTLSRNNSHQMGSNNEEDFKEQEQDEEITVIRRINRRGAFLLRNPERKRGNEEKPLFFKATLANEERLGSINEFQVRKASVRNARERTCPAHKVEERDTSYIETEGRLLKKRSKSGFKSYSIKMPSTTCGDNGEPSDEYMLNDTSPSESDPDLGRRFKESKHSAGRTQRKRKTVTQDIICNRKKRKASTHFKRENFNPAGSERFNSQSDSLYVSEPEDEKLSQGFLHSNRKRVEANQKRANAVTVRRSTAGKNNINDDDTPLKQLVKSRQRQLPRAPAVIGHKKRSCKRSVAHQIKKNDGERTKTSNIQRLAVRKQRIFSDECTASQRDEQDGSDPDDAATRIRMIMKEGSRHRKERDRNWNKDWDES